MTVRPSDTGPSWQFQDLQGALFRRIRAFGKRIPRFAKRYQFTSLTRRIIFLNLVGLIILIAGIFYVDQFRAGLIEQKVSSLETQGEIIAAAIATSLDKESDGLFLPTEKLMELQSGQPAVKSEDDLSELDFAINAEKIAPILSYIVQPTGTRARLYNRETNLILDNQAAFLTGQPTGLDLQSGPAEEAGFLGKSWRRLKNWYFHGELPLYEEIGNAKGRAYTEVQTAMAGTTTPILRVNKRGELVISVAAPIKQSDGTVRGVLLLSAQGGAIDAILNREGKALAQVALVALGVTIFISFLLAQQIADPMRRLSAAADRVRRSIKARAEIPDFASRFDEIGHLSVTLRDMTSALYRRLDAIESFAADVSHELKNPMTSLRSAAETLDLVKKEEDRDRLVQIILQDVDRLERLITDIADASRLDAELALTDTEPVNMVELLHSIVSVFNDIHMKEKPKVVVRVEGGKKDTSAFRAMAHKSRLGQVLNNVIDNAISFSPKDGQVWVNVRRVGSDIDIRVEDEGPGIEPEFLEKIFERFYTDRPGENNFGRNSGLGLNIARQIVQAHGGKIWAENRMADDVLPDSKKAKSVGGFEALAASVKEKKKRLGARIVIRFPAS